VKCPKCGGTLQLVMQDGIEVDRCDSCGGLWFDMLETERLSKMRNAAAVDTGDAETGEKLNAQGKIMCPRCHTQMIRMVDLHQHHIWYDKWFDAGEFRDLQQNTIVDFFRDLFTRERK
jgi:Zn-finger nucleic acid-binding protein